MADEKQEPELPQEQTHHQSTISPLGPMDHLPRSVGTGEAPKTTWPEVAGMSAEEAERKIREERGGLQFQVVSPNCFVTMDFNPRRVRLYLDSQGKVSRTPRIG